MDKSSIRVVNRLVRDVVPEKLSWDPEDFPLECPGLKLHGWIVTP